MSAVPAARYLADFSADDEFPSLPADALFENDGAAATAKLDEEFARGLENGRSEARAAFQVMLEEQQGEFTARLATERQQWAAQTGEELANRLLAAIAELERRVADTTARILKPFLATELRRQAIAELRTSLEVMLAADSGASISVSGPADVLEALRPQLSSRATTVTFTPSDDCDVRIEAGQAKLETRLRSWMTRLEEATR